jgi:O-antigen ligase
MEDSIYYESTEEQQESYSLDFILFLLLNAVLFVRPGDLIEEIKELPIYNGLILACIVLSLSRLLRSVAPREILADSITACVLGLLAAVVVSHLSHFFLWGARSSGYEFFKIVVYYLVLLSVLDTRARLERFLKWLVLFNCCLVALALLQFHEIIEIPSLTAFAQKQIDPTTGELSVIPRLCGTGMFNDPNDLCLILDVSFLIALYWLVQAPSYFGKLLWLGLLGVFAYAIVQTQSRGGVIALGIGLLIVLRWNLGWGKSLPIFIALTPLAAVILARRSTAMTMTEDTAQARVQLWSEGLGLFRQNPWFGIGAEQYEEQVGMVAHNSFIHFFTELGLFGGALFLGAFLFALWSFRNANLDAWRVERPRDRLAIWLMALVGCYACGILMLSRTFVPPTYMVLGLAAAYFRLPDAVNYRPLLHFTARKAAALVPVSCAFLGCAYLYVRLVVRWD